MSASTWFLLAGCLGTLLLGLYLLAVRLGRKDAENTKLQENADARRDADKRMDELNKLSDSDLSKRL